jgi:STE24 endopeptidase
MDSSKRSSHGNAYFTGFGAAKRIVFFDTLISRLAPPEIEAVLAHELGHFSRHHVWKRTALVFGTSLAFLWLLGWLIGQEWFYAARHAHARDLVGALVKLYQDNASTLTPDPMHSAFYDSHPPAMQRIARLQTYQA